jgi:hypothetical protein
MGKNFRGLEKLSGEGLAGWLVLLYFISFYPEHFHWEMFYIKVSLSGFMEVKK